MPVLVPYESKRAEDVLPGAHVVNRGDITDRTRLGVFYTYTYDEMVYDLQTGRGAVRSATFTVHNSALIAVQV